MKNDFWKFSLRYWALPGVARNCLYLQDDMQADVNIVLFCIYAAYHGYIVTDHGVEYLERQSKPWRANVVFPLRKIRQYIQDIKNEDPEFYRDVQAAELGAERWAQRKMDHCFGECCQKQEGEVESLMAISLERYLITHLGNDREKVTSALDQFASIQSPAANRA